jgi:hypothetical protein
VAFDAAQPQKPESRANIKFENNPNDGFNYCVNVIVTFIRPICGGSFVWMSSFF